MCTRFNTSFFTLQLYEYILRVVYIFFLSFCYTEIESKRERETDERLPKTFGNSLKTRFYNFKLFGRYILWTNFIHTNI